MSDLLIRGMEMPKSCDECRIMALEDTNCVAELYCGCPIVFKAHPQGVGHRPNYCPLIPVPPHGRLIDGDKLDEYLKIAAIMADGEAKEAYIDARAEARTMPIIIPAEGGET